MKNLVVLLLTFAFITSTQASGVTKEEPIQHLKVPSVNSMAEAKKIFLEKTFEINSKQKLDEAELQQIHIVTYTLEKSVEYFAENLTDEKQELVKEIAVVVENIHLNSENNRKKDTKQQLIKYFELANKFIYKYWQISA
jgi:hypothetical protein